MKTIFRAYLLIGFALVVGSTDFARLSATSRRAPGAPPPPTGLTSEEQARERLAATHVIEAILVSPDMTFKVPVLAAAFLDTPEWEQRLQQIITREPWDFAKVTFVHFYWKRVSKKDPVFLARMLEFAETKNREFHLGEVDQMLEAEKSGSARIQQK